jgi:hypothetical protein
MPSVMPHVIKMKKHKANKKDREVDYKSEYVQLFGSDEHFAFIAGFTSGGVPYGITHEEMEIIEIEDSKKKKEDAKE